MLRVLVTTTGNPNLLKAQANALQAFLGPHKLHVVNDAYEHEHYSNLWEPKMPERIRDACEGRAVHWRLRQKNHHYRTNIFPGAVFCENPDATSRCADAVQHGLNKLLKQSKAPILILDADMIPFRPFDVAAALKGAPIHCVLQARPAVSYAWNGIFLIDPKRVNRLDLLNFDCGEVLGERVDVGGQTHWLLEANPGLYRSAPHFISGTDPWDELDVPPKIEEFMRWGEARNNGHTGPEVHMGAFLHMRFGGNWQLTAKDEMEQRIERFIEAVTP